jgi:hypothetical protein
MPLREEMLLALNKINISALKKLGAIIGALPVELERQRLTLCRLSLLGLMVLFLFNYEP